jgi:hypothetical protein
MDIGGVEERRVELGCGVRKWLRQLVAFDLLLKR